MLLGNAYKYNFTLYRDSMAKNDNGKFVRKKRFSYENKTLNDCVIIQNSSVKYDEQI